MSTKARFPLKNLTAVDILPGVVLFLFSLTFMLARFRATDNANIIDFIEGIGPAPFQQRWLMWFTVGKFALGHFGANEKAIKQLFCLIDAVCLFAAMWLFYAVAARIFLKRNLALLCTIWLGVAALFHYGVRGNFSVYNPYDLPAFLVAITALYICFNRPQWRWWLIPLIGIGALNRETTLFLVPLLYFCFPQNRRVMAIGLTLLMWVAAYLISRKIVAPTQPGSWMLLYEGDVLRPIATIRRLGSDISSIITFSMFGAFSWLPLAIGMKRIRGSVFSLFWPSILLTLALYSLVANIDELRIYNEILPMVLLQGAAITFSMFGVYKIEALKPSHFMDPSPAQVAYS